MGAAPSEVAALWRAKGLSKAIEWPKKLTFPQLKNQIKAKHPVCAFLSSKNNGGHFVVIDRVTKHKGLEFMDPQLHKHCKTTFKAFPNPQWRKVHARWDESIVVKKP
jgi:hypothetical protein